jgi:hypothetical protein
MVESGVKKKSKDAHLLTSHLKRDKEKMRQTCLKIVAEMAKMIDHD